MEIQCYSIYQGQDLVEEDHLESRQNDRSAFRCVPTVNSTNTLKIISGAPGDIVDGGWRESS